MAEDCAALEETLEIAQTVLSDLERKAAGYTSLTIPSYLSIELKDKRREVENLKTRLETAQLAKKKSQQSSQSELNLHSSIRSRVADEHYIERDEAKRLFERFAVAIKEPNSQPLLFNICGIGGVGKTTLLGRLKEAHIDELDFLGVCFAKTKGIETPLKLMRKLHQQASLLWGSEEVDSFTKQDQQFEVTLFELSQRSVDGEMTNSEERNKIISWFERFLWLGSTGLASTSSKLANFDSASLGFSNLPAIVEDTESLQDLIQHRVRNHPATKDNPQLQALMLEPVAKLTQAFAESLMQITQRRGRSLVLILDTYEKAQTYLNEWLWQYLVEDTPLDSSSVRLVVVGRRSLQVDEGWRKLNQDRKLLYEVSLVRFNRSETENYLTKIGIEKGSTQAKIYKATHGLPYYLDWVRRQREQRQEPDFSKGNQAISDLFLQGLDSQQKKIQKKILQVVACCRWFDLAMIQYLLESSGLDLAFNADKTESYFEWLRNSDFVEFTKGHYHLDDVARDVFRQSYCQENQTQFRRTNALLADYFKQQADRVVEPESLLPDPYKDEEWRDLISEFLYYGLFGKGKDGLQQYIEKVFTAVYLREPNIFITPFAFICAEINKENQHLLPNATDKFFKDSSIALSLGWTVLDKYPKDYKLNFEGENNLSDNEIEARLKKIEDSLQSLLERVGDLQDGFGKCVGMMYRSLRSNSSKERIRLLLQAKSQTEKLQNQCRPKLLYSLFLKLGLFLSIAKRYEDSLDCSQQALELESSNPNAFLLRGNTLANLERYEEALESYQQVVDLDPKSVNVWVPLGATLGELERYEEALESCQKAVKFYPNSAIALENLGATLFHLKRYEEALESYQKVVNLDPKSVNGWGSLGLILEHLERYEEALESFQKLVDLDPKSVGFWIVKGNLLSKLERYEEALEDFQKVVNLNPKSVDSWIVKGDLLRKLERYEESLEDFQKAIEFDAKAPNAWFGLIDTLMHMRRYDESLAVCNQFFKINPNDDGIWNFQALILSLLKDFEKALIAIDKEINLEPQQVLFRANRGIILARAGRYSEAITECEQAINQDPNHESGYYGKACCYALQGYLDQAIDNLRKAIDIAPHHSRREAKHNPDFDGIRDDERFRALVYPKT